MRAAARLLFWRENRLYRQTEAFPFLPGRLDFFILSDRSGQKRDGLNMKRSREEVIGLRLFEGIACAAQLGAKAVTLDSSKTAEGFYRRMGYTKSGISVMERSGVYFRNAIMKKDLLKGEIHG